MQEAFGGSFLLKLFMVFFIIYVAFIGVALNFAKIYRVKNNVINILEQYQYDEDNGIIVHQKLEDYLHSVPYTTRFEGNLTFQSACPGGDTNFSDLGICIINENPSSDEPYYLVKVYHVINFPILSVLDLPITASGETVVIKTN